MTRQPVYLNNHIVGFLTQTKNEELEFTYDTQWLAKPYAVPLSNTLPLKEKPHSEKATTRFFKSLTTKDPAELLNDWQKELPGALHFSSFEEHSYTVLSIEEVEQLLSPLASEQQEPVTLALSVADNEFCSAKEGQFNSHLIKRYPGPENNDLISNEIFCTLIANYMGLATANICRLNLQGGSSLLIERTDRLISNNGSIQVFGIPSETILQALPELQGKKIPSPLNQVELIFDLLRQQGSMPIVDIKDLITFLITSLLCGLDDIPLDQQRLHLRPTGINLLPFTDLVCTAILPAREKRASALQLAPQDFRKMDKAFFTELAKKIGVGPKYLIDLTIKYCTMLPKVTQNIFKDYPSLNIPTTQMISHLITTRTTLVKSLLRAKSSAAAA